MKRLTLLRHAKSTWDDPVARDFDRPLNRRGRRAAGAVGRALREEGLRFDKIVASPAVRVIETLDDVAGGYGGALKPDYDTRLYLASAEILLDVVHETDDGVESLLLVAHSPGLESLALLLTEGSGGDLRDELALKYPTGTVAQIDLEVERWQDVEQGTGTVVRFIRPRDLDPELGPDEDSY